MAGIYHFLYITNNMPNFPNFPVGKRLFIEFGISIFQKMVIFVR